MNSDSLAVFCAIGAYEDPAQDRELISEIIQKPLITVHQVHSDTVYDVDEVYKSGDIASLISYFRNKNGDALITSHSDIALGVVTADCVPVVAADSESGIYGVAHAGRRGVCQGVVPNLIQRFVEKGAKPDHIKVWIGPHICGHCYETGEEIARDFEKQFPGGSTLTIAGGPGVNMKKALRQELLASGILETNINDSSLCTLENLNFYSYRRYVLSDHLYKNGRFFTIIAPQCKFEEITKRAYLTNERYLAQRISNSELQPVLKAVDGVHVGDMNAISTAGNTVENTVEDVIEVVEL